MSESILESVLEEFSKLAAIPRPSYHEEAVSKYLYEELQKLGLEVTRDEAGNVIADLKASADCFNVPRTILQSHMDMVCVANEGVKFNPLTDPIKLIRTDEYLTADGTSLGADDGMGIAEILFVIKRIIKNNLSHGAIRAIFTVNEETGMSGAMALDKKYFTDAQFLINCDSENAEELVIGSAGSVHIDFNRKFNKIAPSMQNSFKLTISGLRGGHSGEEINAGRANAIKVMIDLLDNIKEFELANISGGSAINAIPSSAEVTITTDLNENDIDDCINSTVERFHKVYNDIEPVINITRELLDEPQRVLTSKDCRQAMNLISVLHSGVYAMSQAAPNLVETSANLGLIKMSGEDLTINFFPRSSVYEKLNDFINISSRIAEMTDFEVKFSEPSPVWTENKNSRLANLMNEVFKRQNGQEMKIKTIHAGLECSFFFDKNPALDIVSIGTTNEHIHSPRERLKLSTVEPQVRLILETLKIISNN